jgi:serine protease Do
MNVTAQIKEQPADYLTRVPVRPGQTPQRAPEPGGENDGDGILGAIQVGELTPEVARQLDLPKGVHGVVVTNINANGGAGELQKGDVIEEVNQQPVGSVDEYNKAVSSLDPNQPQVLSVCRHRVRSFLVLRPH